MSAPDTPVVGTPLVGLPTVDRCLSAAASAGGIDLREMLEPPAGRRFHRSRAAGAARYAAVAALWEFRGMSTPEIARALGMRSHSTVVDMLRVLGEQAEGSRILETVRRCRQDLHACGHRAQRLCASGDGRITAERRAARGITAESRRPQRDAPGSAPQDARRGTHSP